MSNHKPWMVCAGNHEIEVNIPQHSSVSDINAFTSNASNTSSAFFLAFESRYRMPAVKSPTFGKERLEYVFALKCVYVYVSIEYRYLWCDLIELECLYVMYVYAPFSPEHYTIFKIIQDRWCVYTCMIVYFIYVNQRAATATVTVLCVGRVTVEPDVSIDGRYLCSPSVFQMKYDYGNTT